jgi:hypothetical protein
MTRGIIVSEVASTNMARPHGRAPRGERLRAGVPHGHWKTTTFVGGLRRSGMVAPSVIDGPMNGDALYCLRDPRPCARSLAR